MLETAFHQGAGLHSLTPQSELRVVAVVSQSNDASELEILWQLCASVQRMGYPVVVLDGTAVETDESPGLQHLLQQTGGHGGTGMDLGAVASSLAVIPAALGLEHARRAAQRNPIAPLENLLPSLRAYGLLVLHASAPVLGPLLLHTATIPLIVTNGSAASVLSSYTSLKQIALDTGLQCTVAALLQNADEMEQSKAQETLRTLQLCAQRHLHSQIRTTTVNVQNPQDLQRLALQLLENAGTIGIPLNAVSPSSGAGSPAHFVRSH